MCTKDMKCILSNIVGASTARQPEVRLTKIGATVDKAINNIKSVYDGAYVDGYVIMPNHIHMIIMIEGSNQEVSGFTSRASNARPYENGSERASNARPYKLRAVVPTVSRIIQQLKGVVTKELGVNIWQKSFYDHIIRDDNDYILHLQYIEENPRKWIIGKDEYYV